MGGLRRALVVAGLALAASGRAEGGEPRDAAAENRFFADLEIALASKAEARGDLAAAAAEWVGALGRVGSAAAAEVLLLRLAEADGYDIEPRGAAGVYERLLRRDPSLSGRVRELATDRLARSHRAHGRFGRAEALERDMGYVNAWAVAGPFGYTRLATHHQAFAPERNPGTPSAALPGGPTVEWVAVRAPHSGRRMDLFAALYPKEGCAYALAQVKSKEPRECLLLARCEGVLKVWWNGSLVADAPPDRAYGLDRHACTVTLRKGWNRLMVKVSAAEPVVACRLADASGSPLKGLRWETAGPVLHEVARAERSEAKPARVRDGGESLRDLRGILQEGRLTPGRESLARAALGVLLGAEGRIEESLSELERAIALAPGRPHLSFLHARSLENASFLPPSARRARAHRAYERAASCEGGFVPADVRIASRLSADGRAQQAIARLRKALSRLCEGERGATADSPFIKIALAETALRAGWYHEARRWAEDAERAGPRWRPVHIFSARYHAARGDTRRAAASWREASTLDGADADAREALARIYLNQGDSSAAIAEMRKALEADPGRRRGYLELSRVELEAGRYTNAENTLAAALRPFTRSPEIHRLMGEVYLRQGKEAKALAEWDEALRLRPGWHELRREAAALRGQPDDFSLPFAVDVEKSISESKGPEDYPRADTILVVDQTVVRIHDDGSYSEITHLCRKALTTNGVEQLSELHLQGELLQARTHARAGRTLEPSVLAGRGTLTMPGVEIGAVVEHKYRRDHPRPPGGFLKLPEWYFRGIDAPHQISDYVVVAPATMDLSVVVRNWSGASDEEEFVQHPTMTREGLRTWRWTARNSRPLEAAAGHEHASALLPHVLVGRARTWEDMNWEVLDMFLGRVRPTAALRAEAASAAPLPAKDGERDASRTDGARAQARALFRLTNRLVRANADLGEASHILAARAGDRVVLLAALLRAAGLDARFALARPRPEAMDAEDGPAEPAWVLPEPGLFRDTLVTVGLPGGERIWLDPSGPHAPFGAIAPAFQGGVAYVVSPEGGLLTTLPWGPLDEHGETTRTSLEYEPRARRFKGTHTLERSGTTGGAYKQRFSESAASWRATWAEDRLNRALSGARLESSELGGLDDPRAPFSLRAEFSFDPHFDAPAAGASQGPDGAGSRPDAAPWREVPLGFERLEMCKRLVPQEKRKYPQKISSPLVRRDDVRIRVGGVEQWAPPGSHAEQTPFGSYNLTLTWEGDVLTVRRAVTIMPQVVRPERYAEFVQFCRRVDAAESAPLRARFPGKKR